MKYDDSNNNISNDIYDRSNSDDSSNDGLFLFSRVCTYLLGCRRSNPWDKRCIISRFNDDNDINDAPYHLGMRGQ